MGPTPLINFGRGTCNQDPTRVCHLQYVRQFQNPFSCIFDVNEGVLDE